MEYGPEDTETKAKHKADVVYLQRHHPELAEFLTEMAQAFGKGRLVYRVTLKTDEN